MNSLRLKAVGHARWNMSQIFSASGDLSWSLSEELLLWTHMKNVSLCNDPYYQPAGRVSVCGKNFNVEIFSDTMNMINVIFCVMRVLIELYPFIPISVTLIVFQDHSSVSFNWKFYVLNWLSWNFVPLLITSSRSWIYHYFYLFISQFLFIHLFCTCSREITDIFSCLNKEFKIGFFSDTIESRSFKLCMIITVLAVSIVVLGLMSLTLV